MKDVLQAAAIPVRLIIEVVTSLASLIMKFVKRNNPDMFDDGET